MCLAELINQTYKFISLITPMTDLSPAAQAVLDGYNQDPFSNTGEALAAVLRAVAEQVVPDGPEPRIYEHCDRDDLVEWHRWDELQSIRSNILAIAAELEAQ